MLKILETTLRDGSYAINFSFTSQDTRVIAYALEKAGFEFIEIGHGVGLNAANCGKGEAAETDEEYLKAAAEVLKKAKFGMFCIPGIARLKDIDMAYEYGMGFIRIGTNVTEMEKAEKYIERAKKYGMFVCTNFMKSYTMEPKKFAEKARLAQKFGADVLYIVDSAGGMLMHEVEEYFKAVQDVCDIPLGYHGHGNLGMAVANTLRAIEFGAVMVDTSIQGLGRSAGNAPTETVVAALLRMGINLGIDFIGLLDIGEKYIRPLITKKGYPSIDIVAGYALFHSSYMKVIRKYSSKYKVDPRLLIIELCKVNKIDAPDELVEKIAKSLPQETEEAFTAKFELDKFYGDEQR